MPLEAIIFDMDGVLVSSEAYWLKARVDFAASHGKPWTDDDHQRVMGTNTTEWAMVTKQRLDLDMSIEAIGEAIIDRVIAQYEERLPLFPGAVEAVQAAATKYRVGLASGSPTAIINRVLGLTGLDQVFETVVYGDTIANGKPAPDMYLEAVRRLNIAPTNAVGIEDSANGVRSLYAAGLKVIATPYPEFPLPDDVRQMADLVWPSLEAFSLEAIEALYVDD